MRKSAKAEKQEKSEENEQEKCKQAIGECGKQKASPGRQRGDGGEREPSTRTSGEKRTEREKTSKEKGGDDRADEKSPRPDRPQWRE